MSDGKLRKLAVKALFNFNRTEAMFGAVQCQITRTLRKKREEAAKARLR